ncbi:STAS domain-containing protein [Pseudonocardia sp.]|uniref:STAS domain-containing protein n=1 Tax=Pseudonocardia sp. TaxID=60912 RepID=UPI003D136DEB
MDQGSQIAVDKPEHDVVLVRVAGPLDARTATRLLRSVEVQLLAPALVHCRRVRSLLVDLSSVSRIDADGLRVLHRTEYLARRAEATMTVVGLDERRDVLPGLVVEVLDSFGVDVLSDESVTADEADLAAAS